MGDPFGFPAWFLGAAAGILSTTAKQISYLQNLYTACTQIVNNSPLPGVPMEGLGGANRDSRRRASEFP
jgi:hypothetical protein